jgi:1-pyrroline-5-carboxylate dehydrogenase
VLLKAAELLATTWRPIVNAATMLGQSKTVYQAEIDAASEMIDFWRFNAHFAQELYQEQPISSPGMWNSMEYRALEGFVYAITPFNFTAIGGNLTTAPALMGNTVLWKPASTALMSGYYTLKCLEAAGLPPGVINFIPGRPGQITDILLDSPDLGGIHFTGSTEVFNMMWKKVGENVGRYRSYPRIVGETGGKDFIVAHPSADPTEVAVAIARGGFEYQGQKCSAASRVYVPQSLWNEVRDQAVAMMKDMRMGDPRDFRNFVGAVIDKKAFESISGYSTTRSGTRRSSRAGRRRPTRGTSSSRRSSRPRTPATSLCARRSSARDGHRLRLSRRQVGGDAVDRGPDVALRADRRHLQPRPAGRAAGDERAAQRRRQLLHQRQADRRAVVGQQPFGGARGSGTNDKAGSKLNLVRWVSARTVKETFSPPRDYKYPFMAEESYWPARTVSSYAPSRAVTALATSVVPERARTRTPGIAAPPLSRTVPASVAEPSSSVPACVCGVSSAADGIGTTGRRP